MDVAQYVMARPKADLYYVITSGILATEVAQSVLVSPKIDHHFVPEVLDKDMSTCNVCSFPWVSQCSNPSWNIMIDLDPIKRSGFS